MDRRDSAPNFSGEAFSAAEVSMLQASIGKALEMASEELSAHVEFTVSMSPPRMQLMEAGELPGLVGAAIEGFDGLRAVEQRFWGRFKGVALLAISLAAASSIVNLLYERGAGGGPATERDLLKEFGNVIMGASVGRVSQKLGDIVTYAPPRLASDKGRLLKSSGAYYGPRETVFVTGAEISFSPMEGRAVLFLLCGDGALQWLKSAINCMEEDG